MSRDADVSRPTAPAAKITARGAGRKRESCVAGLYASEMRPNELFFLSLKGDVAACSRAPPPAASDAAGLRALRGGNRAGRPLCAARTVRMGGIRALRRDGARPPFIGLHRRGAAALRLGRAGTARDAARAAAARRADGLRAYGRGRRHGADHRVARSRDGSLARNEGPGGGACRLDARAPHGRTARTDGLSRRSARLAAFLCRADAPAGMRGVDVALGAAGVAARTGPGLDPARDRRRTAPAARAGGGGSG